MSMETHASPAFDGIYIFKRLFLNCQGWFVDEDVALNIFKLWTIFLVLNLIFKLMFQKLGVVT